MHSGNIRDQSLKLSETEQNFGRFLTSKILGVQNPQKLHPNYHACLVTRHVEKFLEVIPFGLEVITAHTLNF